MARLCGQIVSDGSVGGDLQWRQSACLERALPCALFQSVARPLRQQIL